MVLLRNVEFHQDDREFYEAMPVTERCLFCDWTLEALTAPEGRAAALKHRRRAHPDVRPAPRPLRGRRALVRAERDADRRAFVHGVERVA